ncbi:YbaK/EbsC family protein [Actinokineospora globicatena]|uniref:YbaK/EbsC family protein n=1 Tax=Actinokineospora globicatena TaxID=103729 RepID=UPI0020A34AB9|nr:YbaK/EbsC family protein [Actinokineospora globicatena]MCP2302554.1 Cys-tRNA(Pro) deacylase, prolyl-tRNA editing enzyme YbaK/EbsC [Actinokineospora globicatena]GLW75759.1 aminoacyl-tRNA deacylase [Actinokineospora globicatena]GLW82599.1 aminoacyl-tRNA deacylase [Actinokineospora globicatena]
MSTPEHPGVTAVADALRAAGLPEAAAGIRFLDGDVRTAAAAAAAIGVPVGAIANSLVFVADGAPLLVLTSGDHRADTAKLAALTEVTEVGKATPAFVREHTGQAIGGVAPVGHPEPLRTLVDSHLARYPVVWAAAGHPRSLFPTTYADLVTLTGGTAARVGAEEEDPSS